MSEDTTVEIDVCYNDLIKALKDDNQKTLKLETNSFLKKN